MGQRQSKKCIKKKDYEINKTEIKLTNMKNAIKVSHLSFLL